MATPLADAVASAIELGREKYDIKWNECKQSHHDLNPTQIPANWGGPAFTKCRWCRTVFHGGQRWFPPESN